MRGTQRRECGTHLVGSKPSRRLESQCSRRLRTTQVANNAGAAGYTILCIFNFCLLIILGYVRAHATHASRPVCACYQRMLSCVPRWHGADAECVLRRRRATSTQLRAGGRSLRRQSRWETSEPHRARPRHGTRSATPRARGAAQRGDAQTPDLKAPSARWLAAGLCSLYTASKKKSATLSTHRAVKPLSGIARSRGRSAGGAPTARRAPLSGLSRPLLLPRAVGPPGARRPRALPPAAGADARA